MSQYCPTCGLRVCGKGHPAVQDCLVTLRSRLAIAKARERASERLAGKLAQRVAHLERQAASR